jgi:hypothetical protein
MRGTSQRMVSAQGPVASISTWPVGVPVDVGMKVMDT